MSEIELRVDHLGLIVDELETAIDVFGRLLGISAFQVDRLPEVGLKIASAQVGSVVLEFIEYESSGANFARRVMGSRPGLNHICFAVNDLDEALRRVADMGIPVMEGFPRKGAHGRIAFLDPEYTSGILVELCEREGR